jgi:hypothetical protein
MEKKFLVVKAISINPPVNEESLQSKKMRPTIYPIRKKHPGIANITLYLSLEMVILSDQVRCMILPMDVTRE